MRRAHSLCLVFLPLIAMAASTANAAEPYAARQRDEASISRTLDRLSAIEDLESMKFWVFFTDKNIFDAAAYGSYLEELATTLDPHSVRRRGLSLGPALVDYDDIPVHSEYIARVEDLGLETHRQSRWLNAVSVRGTHAEIGAAAALPIVHRIVPVATGSFSRETMTGELQTDGPTGSRGGIDYGFSFGQLDEIGAVDAHGLGYDGDGVRIAMLDTGYYYDHETFQQVVTEGRIIAQWDFVNDDGDTQDGAGDPEGQHFHGTTTWSITAGFTDAVHVGIAYAADFLLAKTEDTSGESQIEEDNWVAASEWADTNGADVISSSLIYTDWYSYEELDGLTATTSIAAKIAADRGIVVCNGAGNYGTQDWYYIGAPADAFDILAAGAMEPNGTMWLDSSHGPTADGRTKPEVCARGASVYAAKPPGGHDPELLYRNFDGTSMSTPLVAGAAALVIQAHPEWSGAQVREALIMTANNAQTPDNHRGWGRVQIIDAINYGTTSVFDDGPFASDALSLSAFPIPSDETVTLTYSLPANTGGILEIFDSSGRRIFETDLASSEDTETARRFVWTGRDSKNDQVAGGVYMVRLSALGTQRSSKLILR